MHLTNAIAAMGLGGILTVIALSVTAIKAYEEKRNLPRCRFCFKQLPLKDANCCWACMTKLSEVKEDEFPQEALGRSE